jgi:hypothetical protein
MAQFTVSGPHLVPVYLGNAGRIVRANEGTQFFTSHPAYATHRGVYVFAIKAGRGYTPQYVGKATKSFGQECFQPHKLAKCNEALADYAKGSLVLFLLSVQAQKGAPPTAEIGSLEDFLIQTGVSVNPDILNVRGTKQASWVIKGLIRSSAGKPPKAAVELKRAFKL